MAAPVSGWDDRGLVVGGQHVPFLGGAVHYWRLDPRDWPRCVAAIKALGLAFVESYVPWSVHETRAGAHDWSGARDLGRFLDVVADAGLHAVLRPGPHVNAELTGFGFPDRILRDDALLARTARGTPAWLPAPPRAFPLPSYASARLHAEVRGWYAAVAEVVAPRLAPAGPVIALGVDNEAAMFFRLGAYDHDYHPDAIAWWHDAGGAGEPPRAWDEANAEACVRWVRGKDAYVARALGVVAGLLGDVGLGGVARFHNLPPGEPWWWDLPGVARAVGGPAGIDVYAARGDLAAVKRRALHLVGSSALPLVPELGVGLFPWLPPQMSPAADQRDVALALLGYGVRGASFYMAVGRDRWFDAAITPEGAPGPAAAWIRPLVAALREVDWPALRRAASVAVVVSRADARWALASSLLDPVTPIVAEALGIGPGGAAELGRDRAAVTQRRWVAGVCDALDLAGLPYVLVDEGCGADRLAGFRAVIAPTLDRIDAGLAAALRAVADRRGVVVIGPGTPTRDELGRPLPADALPRRAGTMRPGSLDDLAGLADDLAGLASPPETWTAASSSPDVDVLPHADATGAVRAVAIVHRGDAPARVTVQTPGPVTARDAITGAAVRGAGDAMTVEVGPRSARLLVIA